MKKIIFILLVILVLNVIAVSAEEATKKEFNVNDANTWQYASSPGDITQIVGLEDSLFRSKLNGITNKDRFFKKLIEVGGRENLNAIFKNLEFKDMVELWRQIPEGSLVSFLGLSEKSGTLNEENRIKMLNALNSETNRNEYFFQLLNSMGNNAELKINLANLLNSEGLTGEFKSNFMRLALAYEYLKSKNGGIAPLLADVQKELDSTFKDLKINLDDLKLEYKNGMFTANVVPLALNKWIRSIEKTGQQKGSVELSPAESPGLKVVYDPQKNGKESNFKTYYFDEGVNAYVDQKGHVIANGKDIGSGLWGSGKGEFEFSADSSGAIEVKMSMTGKVDNGNGVISSVYLGKDDMFYTIPNGEAYALLRIDENGLISAARAGVLVMQEDFIRANENGESYKFFGSDSRLIYFETRTPPNTVPPRFTRDEGFNKNIPSAVISQSDDGMINLLDIKGVEGLAISKIPSGVAGLDINAENSRNIYLFGYDTSLNRDPVILNGEEILTYSGMKIEDTTVNSNGEKKGIVVNDGDSKARSTTAKPSESAEITSQDDTPGKGGVGHVFVSEKQRVEDLKKTFNEIGPFIDAIPTSSSQTSATKPANVKLIDSVWGSEQVSLTTGESSLISSAINSRILNTQANTIAIKLPSGQNQNIGYKTLIISSNGFLTALYDLNGPAYVLGKDNSGKYSWIDTRTKQM